jgi:hypothetical protein
MKALLLGLLVLCALGAGVFFAFVESRDPRAPAPLGDPGPEPDRLIEAQSVELPRSPVETAPAPVRPRKFGPGTITLRVGEGFDLTTSELLAGDSARRADVVCVDISGNRASLDCPHGSLDAKLPAALIGERPTPSDCFDRLLDAPPDLNVKAASLFASEHGPASGIALVKARSGEPFKVLLVETVSHFRVLSRSATFRYAPVATKPGGGVIRLEGQLDFVDLDAAAQEALRKMLKRPLIPGDTFRTNVGQSFQGVADLPDKLDLPRDAHLGLAGALQTELTIGKHGYGSLYLSKGIGKRGKAKLTSYSGLLIEGDMDGEIEVDSYAYVHITGNLNGTLRCRSYTTVIVDGNVNGLLQIKSYVRLFLGGRFADPVPCLEATLGMHCTFFFSSYTTRAEMERFVVSDSYNLHVRTSDLADGPHQGVGRWGTVTVADPLWQTL